MLKVMYELFLNTFTEFYMHVNVNYPGVVCPEDLKKNEFVKFSAGDKSSPNINILDDGLEIKLRFGTIPYLCFFPWKSLVGIEGNECQFTVGQNFNYDTSSPTLENIKPSPQVPEPEIEEDKYYLKDTKYPHLKIVAKKENKRNDDLFPGFHERLMKERKRKQELLDETKKDF